MQPFSSLQEVEHHPITVTPPNFYLPAPATLPNGALAVNHPETSQLMRHQQTVPNNNNIVVNQQHNQFSMSNPHSQGQLGFSPYDQQQQIGYYRNPTLCASPQLQNQNPLMSASCAPSLQPATNRPTVTSSSLQLSSSIDETIEKGSSSGGASSSFHFQQSSSSQLGAGVIASSETNQLKKQRRSDINKSLLQRTAKDSGEIPLVCIDDDDVNDNGCDQGSTVKENAIIIGVDANEKLLNLKQNQSENQSSPVSSLQRDSRRFQKPPATAVVNTEQQEPQDQLKDINAATPIDLEDNNNNNSNSVYVPRRGRPRKNASTESSPKKQQSVSKLMSSSIAAKTPPSSSPAATSTRSADVASNVPDSVPNLKLSTSNTTGCNNNDLTPLSFAASAEAPNSSSFPASSQSSSINQNQDNSRHNANAKLIQELYKTLKLSEELEHYKQELERSNNLVETLKREKENCEFTIEELRNQKEDQERELTAAQVEQRILNDQNESIRKEMEHLKMLNDLLQKTNTELKSAAKLAEERHRIERIDAQRAQSDLNAELAETVRLLGEKQGSLVPPTNDGSGRALDDPAESTSSEFSKNPSSELQTNCEAISGIKKNLDAALRNALHCRNCERLTKELNMALAQSAELKASINQYKTSLENCRCNIGDDSEFQGQRARIAGQSSNPINSPPPNDGVDGGLRSMGDDPMDPEIDTSTVTVANSVKLEILENQEEETENHETPERENASRETPANVTEEKGPYPESSSLPIPCYANYKAASMTDTREDVASLRTPAPLSPWQVLMGSSNQSDSVGSQVGAQMPVSENADTNYAQRKRQQPAMESGNNVKGLESSELPNKRHCLSNTSAHQLLLDQQQQQLQNATTFSSGSSSVLAANVVQQHHLQLQGQQFIASNYYQEPLLNPPEPQQRLLPYFHCQSENINAAAPTMVNIGGGQQMPLLPSGAIVPSSSTTNYPVDVNENNRIYTSNNINNNVSLLNSNRQMFANGARNDFSLMSPSPSVPPPPRQLVFASNTPLPPSFFPSLVSAEAHNNNSSRSNNSLLLHQNSAAATVVPQFFLPEGTTSIDGMNHSPQQEHLLLPPSGFSGDDAGAAATGGSGTEETTHEEENRGKPKNNKSVKKSGGTKGKNEKFMMPTIRWNFGQ